MNETIKVTTIVTIGDEVVKEETTQIDPTTNQASILPAAEEGAPVRSELGLVIDELVNGNSLSDAEKKKLMDMSLGEVISVGYRFIQKKDEIPEVVDPGYTREDIYSRLNYLRCINCGRQTLTTMDGHLKCTSCGHDYGDIDDFPSR